MPKLTATFDAVDRMSEKFANMYESGNKAFKQWEQAGAIGDKALGEVEKSAVTTAKALTNTAKTTDSLEEELKSYVKSASEFTVTTEEMTDESREYIKSLEEEAEKAKKLADELDNLGDKREESYPGGDSPGGGGSPPGSPEFPETPPSPVPDPDPIDDSRQAMEMYADTLAALGVAQMLHSIADAAMECVDAFQAYETGLAKVSTLADPSVKSMTEISSEIRKVSNEVGQYSTDIAEATYQAISAGVNTADAVEFVATANSLAVGGFTQSATAVDVLTTSINAYGLAVSDASQISDYLITTQNLGKTTVDELAGSVGRVIPIAAAYNVEMDNLSSAIAIMTANGIATAETMTYLKAMLTELGDSGSTVTKVLLTETGYNFAQLTEQGYSLGDVMAVLGDSVNNNAGAFNELWGSTEAGIGALSLMNSGAEKYNSVLAEMENSSGAADKAFKKMSETSAFMEQKMMTSANNLKIAIGEDLTGAMNGLYAAGSGIMNGLTFVIDECPAVTAIITGSATALATLTVGVVGFNTVMKVAKIAQDAFNASAKANPYILAATAVIGLASAVAILATNMDYATSEFKELTEAAKNLKKEQEELKSVCQENCSQIETEAEYARSLASELDDLLQFEEKTTDEKLRMSSIITELNESYPDLQYNYNQEKDVLYDLNGEIVRNTDALLDNIEAKEKAALADAYLENFKEWNKQYVEAEKNALEYDAEYIKSKDAIQSRLDTYGLWGGLNPNMYVDAVKMGMLNSTYINNRAKYTTALDEAEQEKNYYWNKYLEIIGSPGEKTISVSSIATELSEKWGIDYETALELARGYEEEQSHTIESVCVSVSTLASEYKVAYDAALESIEGQYSLWDKVDAKATTSVSSINSAMQSQIDYWNNYSSNLDNLMSREVEGLDEFVQKYNDGSQEAAAMFAGMAKASDTELSKMLAKWNELGSAQQGAAESWAKADVDFEDRMEDYVDILSDTVIEMNMTDEAYDAAMETINGYIQGIGDSQPLVRAAFERMRSTVFTTVLAWPNQITRSPVYGPGYASGTDYATPGWHLVGEEGPEIVYFNGGETVYNAEETDRMLTSAENPFGSNETTDRFVNVRNESSTSSEKRVVLVVEGVGEIVVDKGVDKDAVIEILQSNIKPVLLNILEEEVFEEGEESYEY